MATSVNAGARLDRLPVGSFHYRIFWLVGAGMFFDGYDLYVAGSVLAAAISTKFSTLQQNLQFISLTFVGMTIGAFVTGFLGDWFGRRFTYQVNLLIFGLASFAAAFAQDMQQLIICRFVQGLGLGAEIVVGYSTLTEFVPPGTRGRWLSFMALLVVAGFPATSLLAYFIIPVWGWRPMFIVAGVGALIVWYLRKALPESPRWLESKGRTQEAEALLQVIEKEASWSIIGASVITIITGWTYANFSAASEPTIVLSVGFVLITAIYIQTAILFGVYTPELFPTEVRLRANGVCNTLGRLATVFSPFAVGYLMQNYRLPGVTGMMIALLVVQIFAVWLWGIEPRQRALEDLAVAPQAA
jgi:MFS transporter, putative metabolite:H+ symporter